jgi:Domain of unknown function (DUF4421)
MRNSIVISLILFSSYVYGQIPDLPIETYRYDTNYIANFSNLLAVRLVSPRRIYDFRLKNRFTKEVLTYRPNLQSAFGIGFTYRWLAFDIVFNPKWNRSKNEKFGETSEFNVKGTLYLKKHMLDVSFRSYRGMYIANPKDYLDPWDGIYPYRPDIKIVNFGASYTVPSNSQKYSPKTTIQLDGRLKKSAGSVLFTSSFHLTTLKADSSIVPLEYKSTFTGQGEIEKLSMAMLQQSMGYAYTFVRRNLYLTLSATPGLTFAFGTVQSEAEKYNPASLNLMFESKSGFGYNSRKWYAGIYFIYKYQNIKLTDEYSFNSNLGEWRLFIGYRIHAPYIVNSIIRE